MSTAATSTTITMPQLGESVAEGTIGRWLKRPGERIERDEPLVEVMTDKVNTEIPSPVAGFVQRIVAEEGQTVPVGAELVVIGDEPAAAEPVHTAPPPPTAPAPVSATPVNPPPAATASPATTATTESGMDDGPRRASPLVRRMADEYALDLAHIKGSGLGGRVTRDDVQAYIDTHGLKPVADGAPSAAPPAPRTPAAPPSPVPSSPAPTAAPVQADTLVPLTPMRRAIADHMVRSLATSPHAWGMVEIDVSGLVELRAAAQAAWQAREGFELTFLPFFVKAVVESLRESPNLNARWTDNGVLQLRAINIGIAVAVSNGLVVPVIKDADQKSIAGLAISIRDLAVRGRAGRLTTDDLQGGTFTVNNTGALGSIASGPIINQPQAGIITMEAAVKRVVVLPGDALGIRTIMNSCLAFDHRITDGAEALRLLQAVKRRMEAYGPDAPIY
ncbi:MAG: dihydrolipoamide acetyltransferase family protein [Chloroflexota bacterium]